MEPIYLQYELKELEEVEERLNHTLISCTLCPRGCRIDRRNERGTCGISYHPIVASYGLHFGEEPELVGTGGSGTVFFSGCNLKCIFCQNYDISHLVGGTEVDKRTLAHIFLELQNQGAHNINLVSPTHVVHSIVGAIVLAREMGLKLPIVYNTGGYDNIEVVKLLRYFIDIYMPDAKYGDDELAFELSGVKDYVEVNREVVKEMYRQVGNLKVEGGIALRGLIVRHLVLPSHLDNSKKVLEFMAKEVSTDLYLNIMDQYWPSYKAKYRKDINRRPYRWEIEEIRAYWIELGGKDWGWRERHW